MRIPLQPIAIRENIFGDNIAKAEYYDFSRGNLDDEHRILNITQVASICYQSPKAIGSESLYNRLLAESHSLPSSSFEFVPVLFDMFKLNGFLREKNIKAEDTRIFKFGVKVENDIYLLTNYRAVVYDFENLGIDLRNIYNTEFECEIIKQHYKVFRFKVDFPTRSQMVRHRVNFQELSRRYVSAKRVPMDHYISDKMKNIVSTMTWSKKIQEVHCGFPGDDLTGFAGAPMAYLAEETKIDYTTQQVIDICMNHYYKALEDGIKPQEARRIIPQTGYTEFWMGFLPFQLDNFFRLRDDKDHAQWEIFQTARAMKDMLGMPYEK